MTLPTTHTPADLGPDDLRRLRAMAEAATPGPWQWYGALNSNSVYLATQGRGRHDVMSFRRWGMSGAQPLFAARDSDGNRRMFPVRDLVDVDDRGGHEIRRFRNPDAEYIAAMSPDVVLGLLDRIAALEAEA